MIRIYTTGTAPGYTGGLTAGFINTNDTYGVPVYTGAQNADTQAGLVSGAAPVQSISIPSSHHIVSIGDFSSTTYPVTADMSNAGAGAYAMVLVVEYLLQP